VLDQVMIQEVMMMETSNKACYARQTEHWWANF